ncbi:hypothetical protein NQ315_015945 [Exocentrus adspersus]|uniref:MMS19 nucleotide excision repair protein n=1 Tax=Exocentrus adspersus TaxID=1586481 RepID=A0AAV8VBF4_9CUCU|nr:hypothetical protein NQ315_015945 [Exocentrus adspersus]
MELHFVYGVISSIDGERDPRNLLFLFQWLKTFLNSVSLHHLTEEMFDVLACYFPIDFKASSSSMRNITREDLATELSSCLCAIPEFAEYSIPLALEKLESSLQIAKMDALKLLRDGCMVFSPSSYYTHSTEILFQLQKEVFSDKDNIIKIDCLNTLTAVINKVSQCEENYDYAALNNIVTTLKGNLLPNSKLFQPSVDILLHIAAASEQSSIYVLKKIVPLLVNTYSILSNSSEKVIILKALTQFIKAHIRYGNNLSKSDEFSTVSMICLKACTEIDEELRSTGFDSIANLAELLPEDTRIVLYKCLQNIIMKPEPAYVRVSILKCLKTFSNHYPAEINNNVLQKAKIGDKTSLNLYLNSICSIAGIKYFRDIVTDSLINYDVCDIELSIVSLKNMEQLLKETYDVELLQVLLQKQAVNKLVEYALKTMHYDNDYTELLVYISNVLKMVIGPQDYEIQSNLINYQTNRIDSCRERSEELYMFLMDGLTSRVRKGLSPDCKIIVLFTKISITNSNSLIRDVSVQLLANLINKYPEGDNFIKCLDEIKENCLIYINMYKPNVILVISWIIKALVMRNHPEASFWIDLLLNHLKHDCSVAKGFKIIMNDTYKSLSTISYCNKTLLYQQKFFVMVTDRLCERYNPENVSYLFSIGYLLEYVPEQALLLQFKKSALICPK